MSVVYPETPDFIAYALLGTCQSLSQVLEFYEMESAEDDTAFCAALDRQVFCCDQCGWWFEVSEMAQDDTWRCEECADEDTAP